MRGFGNDGITAGDRTRLRDLLLEDNGNHGAIVGQRGAIATGVRGRGPPQY